VTTKRIDFLEGVRGIAALMVVLQHLLADEFPGFRSWTHQHVDLGRVGVVAFFLVSGYVIPLSLAGQSLRTFALRRFFRLFPVYWVALAAYVTLEFATVRHPVGGPGMVLNVLMVQGMVGVVSVLPPAWTLSIELIFYLQSAAAKAGHRLDAAVHAGWVWLALYLLLDLGERVTGRDLPTTLPMLLFVAALGHALHLRDRSGARVWLALLGAGILVVPAGAYLGVDGGGEWPPLTYSLSFLVGLAFFLTCYALRRRTVARPLVFLGAISYAVYLFHPTVIELLGRVAFGSGPVFIAVALLATVLVAWVTHRWLEQPSINLGRRLTTGRPAPEPVSDRTAS
jgi:peptidoglycan/LPS O-acetylase OafA/YrhL